MKFLAAALVILLFASFCSAAYVYGDIYQPGMQKLDKTVVRVDGSFSYQVVTEKSNYSIFLPDGNYTISATYLDKQGNPALYAEEKIRVGAGDQKVDLVLKPVNDYSSYILLAGLLVLAALAVVFWPKQKKEPERQVETAARPKPQKELDEDAKKVLKSLASFEGRATQKELKNALNFSDAKLSLILTELEYDGLVRKFKRGRGNIIKIMDAK